MKLALFVGLGVAAVLYLFAALRGLSRRKAAGDRTSPTIMELGVGFVTNFFDTLRIGSFAPTTALFKLKNLVPDQWIPGTLNVGHTPPVIVQAFFFIAIVEVDPTTLAAMIAAAVVGAWLGAGVVAAWRRRTVQLVMGFALLVAAGFFLLQIFEIAAPGGEARGLAGGPLGVAVVGSLILGAFMQAGIGFYAPCMVLVSVLGMNPLAAFPIMMGACAYLMPVGSTRFLQKGSYSPGAAAGLALGGLPAVLIAVLIVKQMPLAQLRWLVVVVVLYTAFAMLHSVWKERQQPSPLPGEREG